METESGFVDPKMATVAQWRAAKKFALNPFTPAELSLISGMIRLANLTGIADNEPLWPRLQALAESDVTVLKR